MPKPARAEEVLAALAAAYYPAGATVTLAFIGGVNEATSGQIRRWARSDGRWPYVDGKGARPDRVRPIGPPRLTGTDWS